MFAKHINVINKLGGLRVYTEYEILFTTASMYRKSAFYQGAHTKYQSEYAFCDYFQCRHLHVYLANNVL